MPVRKHIRVRVSSVQGQNDKAVVLTEQWSG